MKKPEEARRYLERAQRLAEAAAQRVEASYAEWGDVAAVHDRASECCRALADSNGSWIEQQQSLQLRRWLHDHDTATVQWSVELSVSLRKMAILHVERHRPDDDRRAIALLDEALGLLFQLPGSAEVIDGRVVTHEMLADIFKRTGESAKADEHDENAKNLRVQLDRTRGKRVVPTPPPAK
jgi:hypothetical protein